MHQNAYSQTCAENMHEIAVSMHKYALNMQLNAQSMHNICRCIDFNIANCAVIYEKYA